VVFAVVMSPETARLIDPAVRVWQADVLPIQLSTRFTIRGRLGVVPIRGTSELTAWDPPQLAEFHSISPTWPFRMTARHQFETTPDGGTDYTWSISFHEVNALSRPLIAILTRLFGRALAAQADTRARYLNQRSVNEPLPPL
jgi:hypothetical protein